MNSVHVNMDQYHKAKKLVTYYETRARKLRNLEKNFEKELEEFGKGYNYEFIIKRGVTTLIWTSKHRKGPVYHTEAICMPDDIPIKLVGKYIALHKALGLNFAKAEEVIEHYSDKGL